MSFELAEHRHQLLNVVRCATVDDIKILGHDGHAGQNRRGSADDNKLHIALDEGGNEPNDGIIGTRCHRADPFGVARLAASRSKKRACWADATSRAKGES